MIHYLVYGVFAFIILLAIYILYLAFDNKKPTITNPYLPNNENPINTLNQIPINNQVYNSNYNNPNLNSNSNNTLGFNNK